MAVGSSMSSSRVNAEGVDGVAGVKGGRLEPARDVDAAAVGRRGVVGAVMLDTAALCGRGLRAVVMVSKGDGDGTTSSALEVEDLESAKKNSHRARTGRKKKKGTP